jgi:hypothetical protein
MILTLKAFACTLRGFDDEDIVHARDASKARYAFLLRVGDAYPTASFRDVRVRRSAAQDMVFPALPPVNERLDERDREIVMHAFGGGSHKRPVDWGHRNHYCTAPSDKRLNNLVALGVFRGPCGVDANGETPGWVGAFFYLTDSGKELARALIGVREAGGP